MNHTNTLILSFKRLSELKKGDVFSLDHDGKNTEYYVFEGFDSNCFLAQSFTRSSKSYWSKDMRVIEENRVHRK